MDLSEDYPDFYNLIFDRIPVIFKQQGRGTKSTTSPNRYNSKFSPLSDRLLHLPDMTVLDLIS